MEYSASQEHNLAYDLNITYFAGEDMTLNDCIWSHLAHLNH
jgi:hypothetical protein